MTKKQLKKLVAFVKGGGSIKNYSGLTRGQKKQVYGIVCATKGYRLP